MTQIGWTSPVSSKLLLEAGFSRFHYLWAGFGQAPPDRVNLIPVTETQGIDGHRANFSYRGIYDPIAYALCRQRRQPEQLESVVVIRHRRAQHEVRLPGVVPKVAAGPRSEHDAAPLCVQQPAAERLRFLHLTPRWEVNDRTATQSLFAQDQWTLGRLTVQGALRYDRAWSWAPAEHNGSTQTSQVHAQSDHLPAHGRVSPVTTTSPPAGVRAWDVFGTGRTALKANIGKYLQTATNDENYCRQQPGRADRAFVTFVTNRGWIDNDADRVIDCDLMNFAGAETGDDGIGRYVRSARRGTTSISGIRTRTRRWSIPTSCKGWGVRPADWGLERVRAARSAAARVGGGRVQPPLVPELLRRPTTAP